MSKISACLDKMLAFHGGKALISSVLKNIPYMVLLLYNLGCFLVSNATGQYWNLIVYLVVVPEPSCRNCQLSLLTASLASNKMGSSVLQHNLLTKSLSVAISQLLITFVGSGFLQIHEEDKIFINWKCSLPISNRFLKLLLINVKLFPKTYLQSHSLLGRMSVV